MLEETNGGLAAFSVDLPNHTNGRVLAFNRVVHRLVELLSEHEVPATWAFEIPTRSGLVDTVLSGRGQNEIAILGDSGWVGRRAGRTRFARELTARVAKARSNGLLVSTLALRDADLDGNLDVLVRNRISTVRSGTPDRKAAQRLIRPRSIRFGVWQVGISQRLADNGWWFGGEVLTARHAINRAIKNSQLVHFVIDGESLAANESVGLKSIDKVLRFVHTRCTQGHLDARTLGSIANRLLQMHEAPVSRSILRAA